MVNSRIAMDTKMLDIPALRESVYKDIPKLSEIKMLDVSQMFGINSVEDFSPDGDKEGKSISWPTISRAVLLRDGYRCRICGRGNLTPVDSSSAYDKVHFDLEVHHIIPRKDGGSDSFRNLITLCSSCHHSTFSNSYSGIPVREQPDLFSFERRVTLIFPPDFSYYHGTTTVHGILRDYRRVYDQENLTYTMIPYRGSKQPVTGARITIEEYRKAVSEISSSVEISDYITMMVQIAGRDEKCRFLLDRSGRILA